MVCVVVGCVECVHDVCVVCAFAGFGSEAAMGSDWGELGAGVFRVLFSGACESDWVWSTNVAAVEDFAGGDYAFGVCSVCDWIYEGERGMELFLGGVVYGGGCLFYF